MKTYIWIYIQIFYPGKIKDIPEYAKIINDTTEQILKKKKKRNKTNEEDLAYLDATLSNKNKP